MGQYNTIPTVYGTESMCFHRFTRHFHIYHGFRETPPPIPLSARGFPQYLEHRNQHFNNLSASQWGGSLDPVKNVWLLAFASGAADTSFKQVGRGAAEESKGLKRSGTSIAPSLLIICWSFVCSGWR